MKAEVLSHFQFINLTCFALVLFFTLFVGALIWVFRKGSDAQYTHSAHLPFE
jgi:cbb3-type cytochrome oxidase subunit 3